MNIAAASVTLASGRTYSETRVHEERLRFWTEDRSVAEPPPAAPGRDGDRVTLGAGTPAPVTCADTSRPAGDGLDASPRLRTIQLVLEALTGRKMRVECFEQSASAEAPPAPPSTASQSPTPAGSAGWGLEFTTTDTYIETEETGFSAAVRIVTADGRELAGSITLSLHREYREETGLSVRAGDALLTDPLVVNFGANTATLGDETFRFDLDADGEDENLPQLGPGSGYLWLDANGDGVVNNGRELFGPATGSGFAELEALDGDGNGWLDSADPLFDKLRIWTREAGTDSASRLAERGIGAILLTGVSSGFNLTTAGNTLLGRIRETGVFARENGTLGTVQEIDLRT